MKAFLFWGIGGRDNFGNYGSNTGVLAEKVLNVFVPELGFLFPVVIRLQCGLIVKIDS